MIWCYEPFQIRKAHAREQNMPFLFMSVTKIRRKDYCFQIRKKAVVGPPCLVHNRFNHCIRSKFETNLFAKFIVGHKNTKIAWWQHAAYTPCNEYHQKHMTTRFGLGRRIFYYVLNKILNNDWQLFHSKTPCSSTKLHIGNESALINIFTRFNNPYYSTAYHQMQIISMLFFTFLKRYY